MSNNRPIFNYQFVRQEIARLGLHVCTLLHQRLYLMLLTRNFKKVIQTVHRVRQQKHFLKKKFMYSELQCLQRRMHIGPAQKNIEATKSLKICYLFNAFTLRSYANELKRRVNCERAGLSHVVVEHVGEWRQRLCACVCAEGDILNTIALIKMM